MGTTNPKFDQESSAPCQPDPRHFRVLIKHKLRAGSETLQLNRSPNIWILICLPHHCCRMPPVKITDLTKLYHSMCPQNSKLHLYSNAPWHQWPDTPSRSSHWIWQKETSKNEKLQPHHVWRHQRIPTHQRYREAQISTRVPALMSSNNWSIQGASPPSPPFSRGVKNLKSPGIFPHWCTEWWSLSYKSYIMSYAPDFTHFGAFWAYLGAYFRILPVNFLCMCSARFNLLILSHLRLKAPRF